MSVTAINSPRPSQAPSDGAPLLRWLIFTGLTVVAVVVLWRFGLIRLMVQADRTYISSIICVLYVAASLHCLVRTLAVSGEGERERRTAVVLENAETIFAADGLPPGLTSDHIRDLAEKARTQGARRLDQTLLLRGLAERMRGSNGLAISPPTR